MLFLLTYDIDVTKDHGKRLSKISKVCESYGSRVQNSVFELNVDNAKIKEIELKLKGLLNNETDSVRIYKLGKYTKYDVQFLGKTQKVELTETGGLFL